MVKIQLIEDNVRFSDIIAKRLRKNNYEVVQSYATTDKIEKADLYIMDINLDELSFDMMKEVAKRKKPIIVFSCHGTQDMIELSYKSWATVFLNKAIHPTLLMDQIKSLVDITQ